MNHVPLHVLFVADSADIGGAERSLFEIMARISRYGIHPVLACPEGDLAERSRSAGIVVFALPTMRFRRRFGLVRTALDIARIVPRLVRLIRRERIDLVHAATTKAQLVAGVASRRAGRPCLWHVRDFYRLGPVSRALARRATEVIAISSAVSDFVADELKGNRSARLIVNGVEDHWEDVDPESATAWRRASGFADDDVVIMLPGRLVERKGHDLALRALASCLPDYPRARMAFVFPRTLSDVPPQILTTIDDLSLSDEVRLIPNGFDMTPVYSGADIVIVPSKREPFGRVAAEAMMARRPVVAAAVDGLTEIVDPDVTGMTITSHDPDVWADALGQILSRPTRRAAMGEAGRARALALFDCRRVVREVAELYRSVTER